MAGIRSGPGWSPRRALGRSSLTSGQVHAGLRPLRIGRGHAGRFGSARYWLGTTSASLQAGRCPAGEPIGADPARPICLVSAAASQPTPVRLGCHGLVAEPLEHPVEDGGKALVLCVFLPGGGTVIVDVGRLIFDDDGNVTLETRSPPGTPRRLRRACHWRAISEGRSWAGPWRTARPGACPLAEAARPGRQTGRARSAQPGTGLPHYDPVVQRDPPRHGP
jgi:hypothetical protein